jgi:hypothetical protein
MGGEDLSSNGDAQEVVRGTIVPTKSSTRLMRQVSALGMEDPVFRTNESGAAHPSNIFDDMGFNDIPTDMIDMMTIASDPTAVNGKGLDEAILKMNLSYCIESTSINLNIRQPLTDSSHNSSKGRENQPPCDLPESAYPRMEDTSNSSFTQFGFSLVRESSAPLNLSKRKIGMKQANSQFKSNGSLRGKGTPQHSSAALFRQKGDFSESNDPINLKQSYRRNKEQWNSSVPSLDLKGAFASSRRTLDSKFDNSSNCMSRDTLLAEAAQALESQRQTFVSAELIEMAKSQRSNTPMDSVYVTDSVTVDEQKQRRALPTLASIFSP